MLKAISKVRSEVMSKFQYSRSGIIGQKLS